MNPALATRTAIGALEKTWEHARKRRRPWVLNHLVTVRCNLACPFCYVSGPDQREYNRVRFPRASEMDTEAMRAFYRQLVAEGFLLSVIVGGEPLLRDDLGTILEVTRNHMFVTVFTNGWLLAERADLLSNAANVFVSLDAPDEQHDRLRERRGIFTRALEGIEVMRRRHPGVRLAVNMTVTGDNAARVPDMLRLARELRLPVAFQPPTYDGQFALDDRPSTDAAKHIPAATQVAEAFERIDEAARRGARVIGSRAFFRHIVRDARTYPCWYPTYVLGPVYPDGSVVACTSKEVIGNVRDGVRAVLRSPAFRANAAAGPGCAVGCRDWGIHDLSALYGGRFGLRDAGRYGRAFRLPVHAAP